MMSMLPVNPLSSLVASSGLEIEILFNMNQDKVKMSMAASTNLANLPLPFPYKLYAMLEDSERNGAASVISWLPDGE
jgi:hypothetical protein